MNIFGSHDKNRGFSLVSILIAAALMGIIAMATARMFTNQFKAQRKVELDAERSAIKRTLFEAVSCADTLRINKLAGTDLKNPLSCATLPVAINLYRKSGEVILSNDSTNPTKVGTWTIRAVCVNSAGTTNKSKWGIRIQAARPVEGIADPLYTTNASDFKKDPLTNEAASWMAKKADLFDQNALLCQAHIAEVDDTTACTVDAQHPFCNATGKTWAVRTGALAPIMVSQAANCNPGLLNPGDFDLSHLNTRLWVGNAVCDTGWHAVGGGVNCGVPRVDPTITGGGVMLVSQIAQESNGRPFGWNAWCCSADPTIAAAAGMPMVNPFNEAVFVSCAPD